MSISFKKTSKTLCGRCLHAMTVVKDDDTAITMCSEKPASLSPYVNPERIKQCSAFHEIGMLSLRQMQHMAYVITIDAKRNVGFSPPRPRKEGFDREFEEELDKVETAAEKVGVDAPSSPYED